MAKTTGPLLSLGASGTIAQTATFSKWKGRPYVRQRVVPANPQTTAQTLTRNVFTMGGEVYKVAGPLFTAPWERFAQGQVLTGRNAFQSRYVSVLRAAADLQTMVFSPGAKGGLPPTSIIVTPAALQLSIAFTNPTPPTGWTLQAAVAACIADDAPDALADARTFEDEDLLGATAVITGLTGATSYVVGAWLRWLKPDGSLAYGPSILSTGLTP